MKGSWILAWFAAALLLPVGFHPQGAQAEEPDGQIQFDRDIRPLLSERCFRCHGPDEGALQAGLHLDRRESATGELESGLVAIVPGDPEASELIARVSNEDPLMRMPPDGEGEPLSDKEIERLRRWIAQGAEYQEHWSFRPPVRPELPDVADRESLRNPIDVFIRARLEQEGLAPQPEADRYTLIRRVSLDLLGLPPDPDAVDRFVHDPRPDAYERLVDRLLADPAFGERWGRVWLDLARYADTAGYAQDPERSIWRYRDWVIQAINANMPFDQFTIEQLAGDLLPSPSSSTLIATAFHRNTMTNSEGGTDDEEFRVAAVVDRVNTTGQVWLGLTVQCAHCHDHKYDPIKQEEYFGLFALWNNTADADRGDEAPNLEEWTSKQRQRRQELTQAIARLEQLQEDDPQRKGLESLRRELGQIQPVRTPIMKELPADQRRSTHIHIRGNFRQQGDPVEPGVPARLGPDGIDDRLELAQWLVSPDNPLTARVTVNRYWEKIFGTGIVETSEDFGSQGERPSHPELLDWLACELVDSGWDIKQLVRLLVTSATYRQRSNVDAELLARDPQNRLLARGPRSRLPAEAVRDQALAVAGLLSRTMYGPSVRPFQPKLGQNAAFGGSVDWDPSPGEDRYRRGLYTFWRRTSPYPSMITFDAPSREFCTLRRIRTNTPLQALVTLNDPVYVEAAQGLARRMLHDEAGGDAAAIAAAGFRRVLVRPPEPAEQAELVDLYRRAHSALAGRDAQAIALATDPLGPLPADLDPVEAAAWTVVANVLLNLDETLSPP